MRLYDDTGLLEEDFEVEDTNFNLGNIFISRRPFKLSIRSQVSIPNIIKDPLLYHPTIVNELQELTLRHCDIEVIPPEISKLVNLTYLNLAYNNIEVVPYEIAELDNLTYLNLSNNIIKTIPSEFYLDFKKLETLILYKNRITNLDWDVDVESGGTYDFFDTLKYLNISHNNLEALPEWIGYCRYMIHLDIIYNNIEELPSLKKLVFLKRFWWYGNNGEYLDYRYSSPPDYNKVNNYIKRKVPLYEDEIMRFMIRERDGEKAGFFDFTNVAKLNQIHYNLGFMSMETETPIFVNKKFKHYDVIEMEEIETTISQYCNEKPGENIVILYKNAGDSKYQHFLTDHETFKGMYEEAHSTVYPCKIADTMRPDNIILRNHPLFNINTIGLVNSFKYILIPPTIYKHLIEEKIEDVANVFVIDGTGVRFPSFVSKAVLEGGNHISAMHCQAGHEGRVGVIRFVREKSLRKKKFLPAKKRPPVPKPPGKGPSGSSSGSSSSSRPSKKRKRGGKRRKSRKRKKNRKKKKKTIKKKKKKR